MIEIQNLTKKYGKITAVNNISFHVGKNEILGFLGPNGAGKSTTMNMITGYLPPTSGTIKVDGIDISENPKEVKKKIGYLPELPPLYTDMKVIEYLKFVAGIKGVPKDKRTAQIEYAMDALKITDMEKRVIKNLSKGYRQRVGFAQALLGNPKVLILDEPTVGLDPRQTLEVRNLIKSLKKNHTIIFSSHILQEVSAVCERLVIINKGVITAEDTPQNLESGNDEKVTLSITVVGDKEKVTDLIDSLAGVISVEVKEQTADNTFRYIVEAENEQVRKNITSHLVSENFEIVEIQTVKLTLEEVFVNLTDKSQK